ncbi:type II toxin-antitoxin system VapC family toxin [Halorientalis marina]|uniref:type II toxin-antitoxin system VapC family toxin n=1 Tax=Halorientalis marina TaxID=2931976 RepID=UPI001FF32DBE|nr:PIN domain-containing protein [Halorientalis marina]
MYVETDFLLALAKESDWLQENAEEALTEHEVVTSIVAYTEFLLLAEEYDIDRVRAVANLLDMVPVVPEDHQQAVLKAATYQDEHGMTTFDAIHAAIAETMGERILGTEQDYDDLEIDRVPLEPDDV